VFPRKEVLSLFLVLIIAASFFVFLRLVGFIGVVLILILREVVMFLPSLRELLASNLNFPISLIAIIVALALV
jgi:hypothetical protein